MFLSTQQMLPKRWGPLPGLIWGSPKDKDIKDSRTEEIPAITLNLNLKSLINQSKGANQHVREIRRQRQ